MRVISFVTESGARDTTDRRTPSPRPSRSLSGTRGHSRAVSRHARGASSVVDVAPCVQWPCGTGEASCSCGSMGVRRRSRARCHGERMPARPAPRPRAARGRPRECSLRSLQVQFSAQSVLRWRHSRGATHRSSLQQGHPRPSNAHPHTSSARRQSLEGLSLLGVDAQRQRPAAAAARAGPMELECKRASLAWAG